MIKQPLPTLLAIDASSSICSLALQVNGEVHSTVIDESKHQGVKLIPALESLLSTNNITLNDIDAFVLSNGPGRFTGLRIAVGFIQGLAYSTHKKIITVNSLQLLAQQFLVESRSNDAQANKNKIWICNKAYNNVYYTGVFNVDKSDPNRLEQDCEVLAHSTDELIAQLKNTDLGQFELVGLGWHEILSKLGASVINVAVYTNPPHAQYIFDLANIKFSHNDFQDVFKALPEYIVNPYSSSCNVT